MNCKISKLFFAALLVGLSAKSFAQTDAQRKQMMAETNVEFLQKYAKEQGELFEKNYPLAVEKALSKGLPLSGVDKNGNSFALVGFYEGTEELMYYKTNFGFDQSFMFNNNGATSSINTIKAKYLHDKDIIGQNITAGIWDGGGVYVGNFDLSGKTQIKDNGAEMTSGGIEHATHVAGTIASRGQNANGATKGLLPDGRLSSYNWQNDVSEMTSEASTGMLVSNHSYGNDTDIVAISDFGKYGSQARQFDLIANNAPFYTIVLAAGNDRNNSKNYNPSKNGRDLLHGTSVSKNTLVVAAVNGIANYVSPNSVVPASFTSYGPTDDYRVKPDIASKGVDVLSSGTNGASSTKLNSGTSMAAPSVTGGVGLLQQLYASLNNNSVMRSSTVRALVAHSALEAGPANGPDHMFGWGLMNVEAAAKIIESNAQFVDAYVREHVLNNSQVFEYEFKYAGQDPLVATIAWNDPAGAANTNSGADWNIAALVNDLDLRIVNVDSGDEYEPWYLTWSFTSQGAGIAMKGDNTRDNIEKVEAGIVSEGNYKVVVTHKSSLVSSQPFSLIISGTGAPLSVTENISSEKVLVYPNPVSDFLNISASEVESLDAYSADIYDISGRKMMSFDAVGESIDVRSLSAGVYILNMESNGKVISKKFIKK